MRITAVCQNPACQITFSCDIRPSDKTNSRGKYCSHACAYRAKRQRILCICQRAECKKTFYVVPSRKQTAKYCSKNCRPRKHICITFAKYPQAQYFVCENPECGRTFRLAPSKIRKGTKGRHCSLACNKRHVLLRNAKYGTTKAEIKRARSKEWRLANPAKSYESTKKRRALKAGAAKIESVSLDVIFQRDKGICSLCHKKVTRIEASIDHVIPLTKSGNHTYQNCVLAHRLCNSRKNNQAIQQQQRLF
jgi:hypothetical protein